MSPARRKKYQDTQWVMTKEMDVAESTGDYEGSADLYGQELVTSSRRLERRDGVNNLRSSLILEGYNGFYGRTLVE